MRKLILAAACLAMIGGNAYAAPITVTFNGGVFGLEVIDPDTVEYTADLTNFTGDTTVAQKWLNAIAFKAGVNDVTGATLASTNAGTVADWTVVLGGFLDNSTIGCDVPGQQVAGKICAEWSSPGPGNWGADATISGKYFWDFDLVFSSGSLLVAGQPIRALFLDDNGVKAGAILSLTTPREGGTSEGGTNEGGTNEGSTQTPEPATLALFGLALAGGASRLRRRMLE